MKVTAAKVLDLLVSMKGLKSDINTPYLTMGGASCQYCSILAMIVTRPCQEAKHKLEFHKSGYTEGFVVIPF